MFLSVPATLRFRITQSAYSKVPAIGSGESLRRVRAAIRADNGEDWDLFSLFFSFLAIRRSAANTHADVRRCASVDVGVAEIRSAAYLRGAMLEIYGTAETAPGRVAFAFF